MKKICALLCCAWLLMGFAGDGAAAAAAKKPVSKATATPGKQAAATPKPGKKATETPRPQATAVPGTHFLPKGSAPVTGKNSYQSDSVSITITAQRYKNSDVYVADIYVKDVRSFQRAYPGKRWGASAQRITELSQSNSAILSMTGDSASNFSAGWVIINGKTLRSRVNRKRDLAILYKTGELVTIPAQEISQSAITEAAEKGEIWQTFLFGPMLVDEKGQAMTKFNSKVGPVNPRSVIGYYEPGHYCFVQVDGRRTASALEKGKKNSGLKLVDLSKFMASLGVISAYNLDGGQSSLMYFNGKIHSTPYKNGRRLPDIVLIREVGK